MPVVCDRVPNLAWVRDLIVWDRVSYLPLVCDRVPNLAWVRDLIVWDRV